MFLLSALWVSILEVWKTVASTVLLSYQREHFPLLWLLLISRGGVGGERGCVFPCLSPNPVLPSWFCWKWGMWLWANNSYILFYNCLFQLNWVFGNWGRTFLKMVKVAGQFARRKLHFSSCVFEMNISARNLRNLPSKSVFLRLRKNIYFKLKQKNWNPWFCLYVFVKINL